MKQILIILVCLMFCSCNKINGDLIEVQHGVICRVDKNGNRIDVESQGEVTGYWLTSLFDKTYPAEELVPNDDVYVYREGNLFWATKANLMQAQQVNSILAIYSNWLLVDKGVIWLTLIMALVFAGLCFFYWQSKSASFCIFVVVINLIIGMVLFDSMWTVDAKLRYRDSGYVEKIDGDVYLISDRPSAVVPDEDAFSKDKKTFQTILTLPAYIDVEQNKEIKCGDWVHIYAYSHDKGNFATSEKIHPKMLELSAMYPESAWKIWSIYTIFFASFTYSYYLVFLWYKRKKRNRAIK